MVASRRPNSVPSSFSLWSDMQSAKNHRLRSRGVTPLSSKMGFSIFTCLTSLEISQREREREREKERSAYSQYAQGYAGERRENVFFFFSERASCSLRFPRLCVTFVPLAILDFKPTPSLLRTGKVSGCGKRSTKWSASPKESKRWVLSSSRSPLTEQ